MYYKNSHPLTNIVLKSSQYIVDKQIKKTKARLFKNVQVHDILSFTTTLKPPGSGGNGIYASWITVTNESKNEFGDFSGNTLANYLGCFELMEIDEYIMTTTERK